VNVLNKQSWCADKGWFSSLGAESETLRRKKRKTGLLRNITQDLELGRILGNDIR
jgi:hypothetical protein